MPTTTQTAGKTRQIVSLILNAAIVIFEILGTRLSILTHGKSMFEYYTIDSNIFALLASAMCVVYTVRSLIHGDKVMPVWVKTLKYMATCCLTVTFVVVLFVLAPMEGEDGYKIMLLWGSMLYHHLICPILALVSLVLLETEPPLPRKAAGIALIPTLVYAAVILTLNITKSIVGPYPFLHVYEQPVYMSCIWFVLILGGGYLLAWLLQIANRAFLVFHPLRGIRN